MDRSFELKGRLSENDWKQYQKGVPVYSRDGQYLGRDIADPQDSPWKAVILTISLGGAIIFHPRIAEAVLIITSVGVAVAGDNLQHALKRTKKILNPQI